MKFLLTLTCFFSIQFAMAQNCPPNIDFESGTFDHWDCTTGNVAVVGTANLITLNTDGAMPGRHDIMDSASHEDDFYGRFPTVCPYGGRYSVKLGNDFTDAEAEGISYTFQIPPSADTFTMTYYYAVVFEDPGHSAIEQPRVFVKAYDVLTGQVIDCASYNYIATGTIPGFKKSVEDTNILYKEWTPSSIDFSGLAGRQVRLEFKTADCTLGAHFGYAYLDVATGCGGVMAVGAYCIETNSVTLNAPYGFQAYTWHNQNYTTVIGSTRTVTLSPPPSINSIFHVDMVPYPGYGCRDTADAMLTVLPVPDTPYAENIGYCQYDISEALYAQGLTGYELLWYTSAAAAPTTIAPVPSTATAGVFEYWVTQKRFFGCESRRKKVTVTISPTPSVSFTVNDTRQCQNGNNFIFNNTTTNTVDTSVYQWDFGDGNTASTKNTTHSYQNAGNYSITLTVTNPPYCQRQNFGSVDVIEKPVADYSYPTVVCESETPVVFQDNSYAPGTSSSIVGYWWKVGNVGYAVATPPALTYPGGQLPVKLVAINADGCASDTSSKTINVHYAPFPKFSFNSKLCDNEIIQFTDLSSLPATSTDKIVKWNWLYDNVPSSALQNPANILTAGTHHVVLQAETDFGCKLRSADSVLIVHPMPSAALHISDSCVFRDIVYTASATTPVPVSKWLWDFGYGLGEGNPVVVRNFTEEDYKPITLIAQTSFNCKDTIIRPFEIYYNRSKAEQDTLAAKGQPVQLITSKDIRMDWYKWSPATGLNTPSITNPVATLDEDQIYELNTLTKQGCDSYSKITIKRYKGPELYVAGAFTPNNHDKLNDTLHIFPVGIKTFNYFCIFNRAGQLLFKTTNWHVGWDGTYKGEPVDPGNYVWAAMAIDYLGNKMIRRGNVVLLR